MSWESWEKMVLAAWLSGTPLNHLVNHLELNGYRFSFRHLDFAIKTYVRLDLEFWHKTREIN